jgi:hypothetical protein
MISYPQESLEVAVQCLETAFELTPDDVATLSVSRSLLDIFQESVGAEAVSSLFVLFVVNVKL